MTIVTDKQYFMDPFLLKQLDFIKNTVKDNNHALIILDGLPGTGKSTFAQQIGYYWDNKLDIDHIVFEPNDFVNTCKNETEKYRVIIWDEAITGMYSKNAMSSINKAISVMVNQIRQRNLFIILCIPFIFDISRDIALGHAWALIHTKFVLDEKAKKFKRGRYVFYGKSAMKYNYFFGKKGYRYVAKATFFGGFIGKKIIDDKLYLTKKNKIVLENEDDFRFDDKTLVLELARRGHRGFKSPVKICDIVNISESTYYNYMSEMT